jgi:hypothetical protein
VKNRTKHIQVITSNHRISFSFSEKSRTKKKIVPVEQWLGEARALRAVFGVPPGNPSNKHWERQNGSNTGFNLTRHKTVPFCYYLRFYACA